MLKNLKKIKLLALFSGVSILSFGAGYQAIATGMVDNLPHWFALEHEPLSHRSLASLPLQRTKRAIRQASFRFLTTSAYSLVDHGQERPTELDIARSPHNQDS